MDLLLNGLRSGYWHGYWATSKRSHATSHAQAALEHRRSWITPSGLSQHWTNAIYDNKKNSFEDLTSKSHQHILTWCFLTSSEWCVADGSCVEVGWFCRICIRNAWSVTLGAYTASISGLRKVFISLLTQSEMAARNVVRSWFVETVVGRIGLSSFSTTDMSIRFLFSSSPVALFAWSLH